MRKTESASDACGNGMVDVALATRLQARARGVVAGRVERASFDSRHASALRASVGRCEDGVNRERKARLVGLIPAVSSCWAKTGGDSNTRPSKEWGQ